MFGSTSKAIHKTSLNGAAAQSQADMRALVKDAQTLLTAAANLSGEKAEEMRGKGMQMLDDALGRAHAIQEQAVARGKQIAQASDEYVHQNPWRTVAVAAGVGLLLGVILGRR